MSFIGIGLRALTVLRQMVLRVRNHLASRRDRVYFLVELCRPSRLRQQQIRFGEDIDAVSCFESLARQIKIPAVLAKDAVPPVASYVHEPSLRGVLVVFERVSA